MKWGMVAGIVLVLVLLAVPALPNSFQWQDTAVQIWASRYTEMSAICSGAWVEWQGKPYVLTAAHCVAFTEGASLMVTKDRKNFEELTLVQMGWKKVDGGSGDAGGTRSQKSSPEVTRPFGKPIQSEEVILGWWDMSGGDWALLTAKTVVRPAASVSKTRPAVGQRLWTYTYPLGLDRVLTVGIVMNPSYRLPGTPFDNSIVADLRVWGGSSGSVVYSENGSAIGLVSALLRGVQLAVVTPLDKLP